ncbi:MAG: aminotransferase [Clostridia bacterium]
MKPLQSYNSEEIEALELALKNEYNEYKSKNLKLDMSRGKPSTKQLDISIDMLHILENNKDYFDENGTDCRNYGLLDGIPEAKRFFAELLDISPEEIIIGGNSSLNMMYDTIARAMTHGVLGSEKPWFKYDKIKFLCPSPGYDRHFGICAHFNIEMITIDMLEDGPDMDKIEKLVSEDETIKGIWCVPKYSNPEGKTYSDEVVRRFANLKPKATDFRIFWDNAYAWHHLSDKHDEILNIFDECRKAGTENMVFEYASTSKVTFPGAGVALLAASVPNVSFIKKQLIVQTIGPDKLNQLRHVKYFKDANGLYEHMKKHGEILKPKFNCVLQTLKNELDGYEVAEWNSPRGGYFVSLNTMDGCAKRTLRLLKEAGVVMTSAGATFPYGVDKRDRNIRIAPTFPPLEELETAMKLFCICVKLASCEKILSNL